MEKSLQETNLRMPPLVSIVGKAKSGKTTLIEKLILELKSRGYKVATIKHAFHGSFSDEHGKDSWRHIQAGSEATAIGFTDNIVLIKPVTGTPNLDQIVCLLGEAYDIILVEGFKHSNAPKIEVHRKETGPPLDFTENIIAIATDEPLETSIRQFSLEDIKSIADILENDFIKPQRECLTIYVNNSPLPLNTFPKDIMTNTLIAMVSSFKGAEDIKSLEIHLRKESKP